MSYNNIIYDGKTPVATISFNRPEALNALNSELFDELDHALDTILSTPSIRVLILTGKGEKAFIAGADIAELSDMDADQAKLFSRKGQKIFSKIEALPIPVIAAVNGFALGGGLETALACDFIYASDKALFGLPEINLGLIPGFGGTQRLARIVGMSRAKEIIFTGKPISSDNALEAGLINKVCKHESLMEEVLNTAALIASKGKLSLKSAKQVILNGLNTDLETGCKIENTAFSLVMSSHDGKEGTKAFLEKRKPDFKDYTSE